MLNYGSNRHTGTVQISLVFIREITFAMMAVLTRKLETCLTAG